MSCPTHLRYLVALCFLALPTSVAAESWQTEKGTDTSGHDYANTGIKAKDAYFSLSCNTRKISDGILFLLFSVPSLPDLPAEDSLTTTLTLQFDLSKTSHSLKKVSVSYFDGGPGDRAWVGKLPVDSDLLANLTEATRFTILNEVQKPVQEFPTTGLSAGAKAIKHHCKAG